MYSSQCMPGMPMIQPMTPQFRARQGQNGGFNPNGGSTVPMVHFYTPTAPSVMPQSSLALTAFAGFTMPYGSYFVPNHYSHGGEMMHATPYQMPANTYSDVSSTAGSGSQPWYFDTGATSHITNNA